MPSFCLGFVILLLFMLAVPFETSSVERSNAVALKTTLQIPPGANAVANSIKASGTPPDRVALLLARPLFKPGRRPPASAPAQGQEPVTVLPRLAGVVIAPGRSVAIFQEASSRRPTVLQTGEVLAGAWNVTDIAAGSVTLVHDDTVLVLVPHGALDRSGPSLEPPHFWKVGQRRSERPPSYLRRPR